MTEGHHPDPVDIASRLRSDLDGESREVIDRALTEALRAYRNGADPDRSVEIGLKAVGKDGAT
jgi:hypothetical protein